MTTAEQWHCIAAARRARERARALTPHAARVQFIARFLWGQVLERREREKGEKYPPRTAATR